MSKRAKSACALAFLMAAFGLLAAFTQGPTLVAAQATIAAIAGIGILRRRAWSAYGFALYLSLQVMMVWIVMLRSYSPNYLQFAASTIFGIAMAALLFRAGRSLEASGAGRGRAWPWIAISLLCSVPLLFLEPFDVPSTSMENTIIRGDRLFVRAWPKPQPEYGDIWALHDPLNRREAYLKRIVGMPGDRIRFSNKILYRNGTAMIEPYVKHGGYFDIYRDDFPSAAPNARLPKAALAMFQNNVVNREMIAPKDHYFVLGDNRDNSFDSRYFGFVAADDLIGKPWLIYDSREFPQTVTAPDAFTITKPRWNRLFKLL